MSDIEEASDTLADVHLDDTHKPLTENTDSDLHSSLKDTVVTIGATVPTGFEFTAADEVKEKLGSQSRISKDRGKIYFEISVEKLSQVHRLRSVDNLFVVVQEFTEYQFKETKEDALKDLEDLAKKLPWSDPLTVWKLNTNLKKRKTKYKKQNQSSASKEKLNDNGRKDRADEKDADEEFLDHAQNTPGLKSVEQNTEKTEEMILAGDQLDGKDEFLNITGNEDTVGDCKKGEEKQVLKFRVTCNRVGDKHSFTSNDAARDFGGAVQDYFQWKADMTNFDVEVLLNINNNEIVVGIALTEESLHRRNITHFGPTTLRSTLAYGMLRLCNPQPTDIIIDPMSGTGAIPIEGATEWPTCYHIAGDNNPQAMKRAANNICSLLKKNQNKESGTSWGMPIDAIQWDICNLPLRTSSVDVIVTDMPFGKRIGSKKKNWDLYPACLMEMSRICRPGTGRAVLLTQDRKCFAKALSKMGHLWQKGHTLWVNIGGLHAAVYLLKRTLEKAGEKRSYW
uniref:THUMP domain containing 3 n=1 Tax=Pelodiscus sinensis TaxID=13735 RepID=K7FJ11_PELSI|nr:THUMP domain-containing protein 3 [Pelodiscus sinensis]XP_006132877.1 THUMP domain-containing protein 3 [Pelodiscus sinensis]XP_006132878.1 THUMP domain-containing protein 3 [Pelodiscus sinensis]XP_006132879.1 THUMP domain-containing protein 3 [Pelodiscus sinensis]|eukprot:XP_006132876.1 THUMP domain-containing protein 3 [Pelodiscus sinensis]